MAVRRSFNAKLYITLSGGQGGTFVEVTNCMDCQVDMECEEADATTRAGGGYKATVGTILAITVSFGMVQDYSDTHHAFLRGALLARTSFGVRVLDKASGEGPKFDGECFKFGRGEPLNGILTNEIVLKPTYSTTPPSWVTGS